MKKKLLILAISLLCLMMTGAVILGALAIANDWSLNGTQDAPVLEQLANEETPTFNTTTPVFLYDFTTDELEGTFANGHDMTHTREEGKYYTFNISGSDPYVWIKTPDMKPTDAKYVVVMHRGNVQGKNIEFYYTRSDNGNMGTPGTNFKFPLTSGGDWSKSIAPCSGWADAGENIAFEIFRLDPLDGAGVSGLSIDVEYIAFFGSEADANGFDFEQYKAKLAYEEEQKRQEEEADKITDWPNPEFKEMDVSGLDLSQGTLKYIYSEDGSTVTISYDVNGELRSYTVPNNKNMTSGGFAATDDLNRSLYNSETVGMYGSNGEHYVGLFYFLWHGEHGDSGAFDLQKIIDENGIDVADNVDCGKYGPEGAMHWFAEPLYGYYYAKDAWVQRKHAELLCNANIDFLYFDVTNSFTYKHNALQLMEILHQLNEEGYDAPQIVFYTNTNSVTVVRDLYSNIYAKNKYPDTWFRIDGKPVIVAEESANINDFFYIKANQWPNEASKVNGWPWMDFDWPQRVFYDKNGEQGAINVSIAQHSGTVCFSHSSLYNNFNNRGRSFTNPEGYPSNRTGRFTVALENAYNAWKEDQSLTNLGLNFQAQWDRAIESEAEFVLVTGWNEWVAQRQPTEDGWIYFVDTASMEFSRDAEMMRGGYFDNYYIQMIYNVQKLNGTAPVVVQDARIPINVTGEFDQWNDVTVTYNDPTGDTVDRNATGFGRVKYTNESGRNDIVASKVVTDSKNIHFYVETVDDITMYDTESSWMQLYIDADSSAETGWYGYDYIVNYKAKDTFTTTVAKYNGKDGAYGFESVGEVSYRTKGNQMMITVPLELLDIEGYKEINLQFKWADSKTTYDEMEDFYIDGDCAPLGRLNYVYQNYIPGVSEITYPENETVAETEPVTEPVAETEPVTESVAETEPVTETEAVTEAIAETQPITEAVTEKATEEPATEKATDAATTPVADTEANTAADEETDSDTTELGCASAVLSLSGLSLMGMIALGAITIRKKRD
ncbi:MAG: hypothetical protein E7661_09790 [Ruminococcaceae bacterium]|nr:hypothetical protein [Oscillospiraceae bacterium]